MAQIINMGSALNTLTSTANQALSAANAVSGSINNIAGSLGSLGNITSVQGAVGALSNIAGNIGNVTGTIKTLAGALSNIGNPAQFASAIRSINLPTNGEISSMLGLSSGAASFNSSGMSTDWRVRLSVPDIFASSLVLQPLLDNGRQLIFPYTPQISISGSASYEETAVTHQNYQFQNFATSKTEQIQIVAPFYVEDVEQAKYWLAATHFLRSASKMFSGEDPNAGNPPPILKLNGYGNYVFKDVPVIIKQFTVELGQTDYINIAGQTWVPVKSSITLGLQPIYSKAAARDFSLLNFVNGYYVNSGYV